MPLQFEGVQKYLSLKSNDDEYTRKFQISAACEWNQRVTDVFSSSLLPKRSQEDRNFLRYKKRENRREQDQSCRGLIKELPAKFRQTSAVRRAVCEPSSSWTL
ncbi:hypothetical protein TNCV_4615231 [Trichonephila clavipes]|nr:hypothetical protein TNCV_4615231 [Trichonephila clavipes]